MELLELSLVGALLLMGGGGRDLDLDELEDARRLRGEGLRLRRGGLLALRGGDKRRLRGESLRLLPRLTGLLLGE